MLYDPNTNFIVCANHFQGKLLVKSEGNIEQLKQRLPANQPDAKPLCQRGKQFVQKKPLTY